MTSSYQFQRLLPLVALIGAGVGAIITMSFPIPRKRSSAVFQKTEKVSDFDCSINEHISPKKDYINRLPDDILRHIISYLGTEDALRISLLSRRWRKLYCTLLPNPKFEFPEFVTLTEKYNFHRNYNQRFITAVDTFLSFRSGFPMESFTLRFGLMREFPGHLRRWLNCIVRSGVRKLDLNFSDMLVKIPDSEKIVFPFEVLLSAYMLEYLKLSFCILEPNFQGLSNSLKELILWVVPLVNGEVESILSSCPQLSLLELSYSRLPCKLLVNAPGLRTLKIIYCEEVNEIGVSAPSLDFFEYYGNCGLSLFPSYVPNLRKLSLDLKCHNEPPHGFGYFVRDAPCLDCLWIQAFPYQVRYIQTEMPTLWNLHTLSLHVIKESLDLRDIMSMIAVCPNLSKLELSTPLCSLSYTERDAEVLPTCVHLKIAAIDGFKFDDAQKKFASQLIRCAPALEQMRLYTAYCKYNFGVEVEKTLPLERRVFSHELISRTKQELEQVASASLLIHFFT